MQFTPPLSTGYLLRRYKRFLVEIAMPDGTKRTIHCPNTGSMLGCSEPGSRVAFSSSASTTRKYPETLEMVFQDSVWIGVNTSRTNALVAEALSENAITGLEGCEKIIKEVKTSDHCRLDLMVQHQGENTYIEVKNCSLVVNDTAYFPDAVTERGAKHLYELIRLKNCGYRAVIFYLVQRADASAFAPADHIDPHYGRLLREAASHGVEIMAYRAEVSPLVIRVAEQLPVLLN